MTDDSEGLGAGDGGMAQNRVTELVEEILGSPVSAPVRWAELSPVEAAEVMAEVAEWVRWLVTRYGLDSHEIPPCWWRHGPLVEELTALRGSWLVASEYDQSAAAMAEWHGQFHEARQRLREWASRTGCSATDHRSGVTPPWVSDQSEPWRQDFLAGLHAQESKTGSDQAGQP